MKVKKLVATVAVFGAGFAAFSTGSTVQAEPVSNSYVVVGSDTIEDVLNALVNGTAITGATVRVTQNGATLGSFDATGGPSIITRPGGVRFSRPNGSSEGFQALSASISTAAATQIFTSGTYQPVGVASVSKTAVANYWMAKSLRNVNIFGQVDIARSSSATPASTTEDATNGTIARIPFGRDAFGLAFTSTLATKVCDAGQDGDAGAGCTPYLTTAQLKTLFDGGFTVRKITSIARTAGNAEVTIQASGAFAAYPVGSQITIGASTGIPTELVGEWTVTSGASPNTIAFTSTGTTALSLASTGTGAALTGSQSLSSKLATPLTIGTTSIAMKGIMPQQGSGTYNDFIKATATEPTLEAANFAAGRIGYSQEHDATGLTGDQVMPMSASRWIAMKNGASFNRAGTAVLGSIYTTTTLGYSPANTVDSKLVPNSVYYYDTTWGRDTFLFVERARVTSGNAKYDANLAALVDPTLNKLANIETTGASKAGKVKELYGLLSPTVSAVSYFVAKPQSAVLDND